MACCACGVTAAPGRPATCGPLDTRQEHEYHFDIHRNIEMDQLEATAKVFRALANPQRLALFERLRASALRCRDGSRGEMCVCDIAGGVALSLSAVSAPLQALKAAGLLPSA